MSKKKKSYINHHIITDLMVLSIAIISFMTYRDILGYFFTGLDSLNLIEESRFNSFRDVLGLFVRPMTQEFAWYRPLAVLSYGMDHAIWGLNPFGFQLTQLLLHTSVSVFIFFFVRFLLNGKQVIAWLSGLIFAIHPIHIEVIPVTARRNDMILTLFILPSLILFIKYFSSRLQKKVFLVYSLLFYFLALGTKELAVIIPVMIFAYVVICSLSDGKSYIDIIVNAVKRCSPYLAVTVIYLIWRMYIIGGIGGYTSSFGESYGIINSIRFLFDIGLLYFLDLVYPVDFLRLDLLFSPSPTPLKLTVFLIALFVFFIFLLFYRKAIFRIVTLNSLRALKILKILLSVMVILSLACILIYPLVSFYINHAIQQAYDGEGQKFLTNAMENINTYPVEIYFYKARDIILKLSLTFLFLSVICLIGVHQRDKIKEYFMHSTQGKLVGFLLIWLLVPLGIYLSTLTFDHHDMYVSVIPFSLILSIILFEGFHSAARRIREYHSLGASYCSSLINSDFVKFIIIAGLTVSLLAYSPLVRTYGEWEDAGKISKAILDKISKIIPELPNDAVLHIYNFPSGIASHKSKIPHAREVAYYAEFSIESWIDMTYQANRMKVLIKSKTELTNYPDSLDLKLEYEKENNVRINIIYNGDEGT